MVLVLVALLLPTTSAAPPQPITALAPFEVWADGFDDVRGIAVDHDGGVFVADHQRGTVLRIAPDRTQRVVARQLNRPLGVAFDDIGRLLVAEEGSGRVLRLETGGTWSVLVSGLKQPRWITVSEDGTIFVSARRLTRRATVEADDDDAEPQVVVAISSRGARVFADDLRRVEGLAATDDALFIATRGRRDSARADGIVLHAPILTNGSAGSIAPVGADDRYKMPLGLARDVLGNVWLAAPEMTLGSTKVKDVIAKLRADGTLTRFAGGLADPQGLAFDAHGNLFVADGSKGRIVRFAAPAAPVATVPPFTNRAPLSVTGSGEPGARIDIFVNEATTGMSASTNGTGAFTLTTPVVANHANTLTLYVTARAGDGLSSVPTELATRHDGMAPAVAFGTPAAGAFVRGTVAVTAQASDIGSGVAALSLNVDGRSLPASVTPTLPATAASAIASWSTTVVADGAHELRVDVVDGAGNAVATTRAVIVDNTPPDTMITAGPSSDIQATTAGFTITGADALTPVAQLQFAWRLDGGAWSTFSPTARVDVAALVEGAHVFEAKARDLAGNEDATPARRDFTVRLGGVRVMITQPTGGASMPAGIALVRGTVNAPGAVVVTANGVPALGQGTTFAALIPVDENTTSITAIASSGDATTSATVSISVAPGPSSPTMLVASPIMGVAPLTVAFSMVGVASDSVLVLDADGDGVVDTTGTVEAGVSFVYTTPGLYVANATAGGVIANAIVQVLDRQALDTMLQATWTTMKDALRAGDVAGAITNISSRSRADYGTAFGLIARLLPGIDSILTTVALVEVRSGSAIYEMLRTDDGILRSFEVRFAVDTDGLWRLDSF